MARSLKKTLEGGALQAQAAASPSISVHCYACRINLKFLRLKVPLHKLALAYLSFLISYHPGGLDMVKCGRN